MRTFDTLDVISAVRGVLVSPRGMDAVYDVLGFLHGRSLWTHELPNAGRQAELAVTVAYPWIGTLDTDAVTTENWREWGSDVLRVHPPTVALVPLAASGFIGRSPIETAVEAFGEDRVVVIEEGR